MRAFRNAADSTTANEDDNSSDTMVNHATYSVAVNVRDLGRAAINLGSDGEEEDNSNSAPFQPRAAAQNTGNEQGGRNSLDSGYESDRDFLPLHWEHPDSTSPASQPGRITNRRLTMAEAAAGPIRRERRQRRRQRRDTGIHRVQDPVVSSINVAECVAEENELVAELRRQRTVSNSSTDSGFSEAWTWRMEVDDSADEEEGGISSSTQELLSGLRHEFAQNLTMVSPSLNSIT